MKDFAVVTTTASLCKRGLVEISRILGVKLGEPHFRRYAALLTKHGRNWQKRRAPSDEYNCAGHVWASRRTCIYEEEDWRMILNEDGFQVTNEPAPEDLIMYIERDQGILHIARVVELKTGLIEDSRRIPWVVSKWSDVSGEVFHFEHDHPFKEFGFIVSIEYWTDRPTT